MTGAPVFMAWSMTLHDLLAEDLAQGAAEDGEVLGEDADRSAVDGAVAGDNAVSVGTGLLEPECVRAVAGQLVEFDEGVIVEQQEDALAGEVAGDDAGEVDLEALEGPGHGLRLVGAGAGRRGDVGVVPAHVGGDCGIPGHGGVGVAGLLGDPVDGELLLEAEAADLADLVRGEGDPYALTAPVGVGRFLTRGHEMLGHFRAADGFAPTGEGDPPECFT